MDVTCGNLPQTEMYKNNTGFMQWMYLSILIFHCPNALMLLRYNARDN